MSTQPQPLPTMRSYGNYSSENYGAHCLKIELGRLTLWFSYQTVIAFQADGDRYVRQNDWSTTTGKHLNWIDGGNKKHRLMADKFEEKFNETLAALGLTRE